MPPDGVQLPSRSDTASYIRDMLVELRDLAWRGRLPELAYFIDMARLEAVLVIEASRPPAQASLA